MKKKLSGVVTCTLLAFTCLNAIVPPAYAQNEGNQTIATQGTQEKEMDRTGLLGYYFKGNNFNELALFAPTRDNTLIFDQETADALLDKDQQTYQSIRWVGLIQSKETGDFTFQLSDDQNAKIKIDGHLVSNQGTDKQVVHLEKDKLVPIKIEYKPEGKLDSNNQTFKELKLFKINKQNQMVPIQQEEVRNPDFNKEAKSSLRKKRSVLSDDQSIDDDDTIDIDTDNDKIPDVWEENGYTIKNKLVVKWDDSLAAKGYTKFVSNPNEAHTVGDPYTDYEKAARDLPLANAKETFNPLVAAFPSVNVNMEKMILSPNKDLSESVQSNSSTNWSYSNTVGASVEIGFSLFTGPSFGVSANYQHSDTVAQEWGSSNGTSSQFNTASAGYLNANVRYNNVGTGAIYDVKPTTSFVIGNTTIGTITAKANSTALSLTPGASYPKKGQNGIAINTMDDFGSHPITLNKQQLSDLLNNKPIKIETNQTDGKYMIKDADGKIKEGGQWNGITEEIEARTASIIVDTGNKLSPYNCVKS
ncbi:binary toxin-like calcium binding domain-containing protein [Paenibacillus larvae]|uniref:binary toxin-like calcium binding domain-containing protein n=1 Tax=Paenibacillus larvae TaxID=1464 RepID=UPI002853F3AC|nr:binary toxin-like calcium binding domain-containing protein [Paenibacillus larvae]MDR5599837.1 binary toxin-like calcium binding domain-containing protein [Paenibacillus larvae]